MVNRWKVPQHLQPRFNALCAAVFCFGANTRYKAAKAHECPMVGLSCPDLGTQMLDVDI